MSAANVAYKQTRDLVTPVAATAYKQTRSVIDPALAAAAVHATTAQDVIARELRKESYQPMLAVFDSAASRAKQAWQALIGALQVVLDRVQQVIDKEQVHLHTPDSLPHRYIVLAASKYVS